MPQIPVANLLVAIPQPLRDELINCYREIVRNYRERRWEPAELNGGKFCEVVFCVLDGAISGNYPAKASKPSNMVDACRALEGRKANPGVIGDRSLRILIPRLLPYLYEIRNNRGVGHVGGDVNPNHADAEAVLTTSSWVVAELVRIFHQVSLTDAQESVDALIERRHPLVWDGGGVKRVLNPELNASDQTLILLHSEPGWMTASELRTSVDYSSTPMFRTRVLEPLHAKRLIEFDKGADRAKISPLGQSHVESNLL